MAAEEELDTKWLASLLKKSFRDRKPSTIVDITSTLAVALGENFLSTVHRVKIATKLGSGKEKHFSVIVKRQIAGGKVGSVMKVFSIFPIEIKMYTVILPMMEDLMNEYQDKRDILWCHCLGYEPYHTIVMDDLIAEGYSSIDRTKWQSIEQSQMVLRALARYHAMTKVLLARGLINETDKGRNLFVSESPMFRKVFPAGMVALSNAILTKWGDNWRGVGESIQKAIHTICDKMRPLFAYDKRFEVLNHGDLWSSNVMWKFTEYGNVPSSVRFIDWQFAHLNSFILDVMYFLYSSVIPSLRRENLNLLFETYQEALEKNLKYYQYDGYIPTIDDVKNEYNRNIYYGFVFVSTCLPVTSTGTSGMSIDIGGLYELPAEEIFNLAIFTEDKYVREVGPDLRFFYENGII